MRARILYLLLMALVVVTAGCARLAEPFKVIWGTSTTALENARLAGLRKTYTCGLGECFQAVLNLARDENAPSPGVSSGESKTERGKETIPDPGKFFNVFLKDPHQKYLVVMGIIGNVDTTEVGIFFDDMGQGTVRVEISSLSSTAKRKVAKAVFAELEKHFSTPPS